MANFVKTNNHVILKMFGHDCILFFKGFIHHGPICGTYWLKMDTQINSLLNINKMFFEANRIRRSVFARAFNSYCLCKKKNMVTFAICLLLSVWLDITWPPTCITDLNTQLWSPLPFTGVAFPETVWLTDEPRENGEISLELWVSSCLATCSQTLLMIYSQLGTT